MSLVSMEWLNVRFPEQTCLIAAMLSAEAFVAS